MLMMLFILKEKVLHSATTPELPLSAGDIVLVLSKLLPQRTIGYKERKKLPFLVIQDYGLRLVRQRNEGQGHQVKVEF